MDQLSISGMEPTPKRTRQQRKRQLTRGDHYGINANALARDAKSKIEKISAKITKLQEPWADADPMIEQAVASAVEALTTLSKQFSDSAEYMSEAMDD